VKAKEKEEVWKIDSYWKEQKDIACTIAVEMQGAPEPPNHMRRTRPEAQEKSGVSIHDALFVLSFSVRPKSIF
jgi:hypothetical protein